MDGFFQFFYRFNRWITNKNGLEIKKNLLEEGESFKRLVTKIKEDCRSDSIPESCKKLINGEHSIDNFLELYSGYSREQWVDFMMELPIIVRLCLGV